METNSNNKGLSIKANMLWNSVGSVVYLACQWLITVLVVRLSHGYDAAGVLAVGMAVANVFTPIAYYKIRAFQVSDIKGEYSAAQYFGFRIVTTIMSIVVLIVYTVLTCSSYTYPVVFLYALFSLGPVFADVLHGMDQQNNRMDIIGISYILRGVLSLITFVFGFLLLNTLEAALVLMVVSTFAIVIFYDYPKSSKLVGGLTIQIDKKTTLELLKRCFPAVVALFFCCVIPAVPRQVLEGVAGSDVLGIYASLAAPVLIVQMGVQYVYLPLLGKFGECYTQKNKSDFIKLLLIVIAVVILVTVLAIIVFSLFGEFIYSLLFGDTIVAHLYMLNPLIICTASTALAWFVGDLLIAMRDMIGNLLAFLIAFVICIVLMYPFVNIFLGNGISFVVGLAFLVCSVFGFIRVWIILSKD